MKFKTEPYKHQLEAFEKFKDSEYFALFQDMGTGKSKVAIDICTYKFQKQEINACLVIAPNGVHQQWINEQFPLHCSIKYFPFIWESGKNNRNIYQKMLENFLISDTPKLKILSVNVEAFQSKTIIPTIAEYVKNHKVFIIVDESTRIKTPTAKRSMLIHRLAKYGCRAILTGTPTAKSPIDLWSQFEFLKQNYFEVNYFIFQHRYGIIIKGINEKADKTYHTLIDQKTFDIIKHKLAKVQESRGNFPLQPDDYEAVAVIIGTTEQNVRFIEKQEKFVRFKKLNQLKEIIQNDVFAVKKEDCLDLPEKIYEYIYIELPKPHMQIYKNLKTQLLAQYEDQELTVINKISLTTRLMQICGGFFPCKTEDGKQKTLQIGNTNPKLERLKEDLEEANGQIIIWAQFVKELELIYQELKKNYTCELYYGGTGKYKRELIIQAFKKNEFQIFIGNPQTAGFGLNLQNSTLQYYFSNSFKTELRLQAEDRSHRIGVKSACVYKDIIAKDTIDQKIFEVLKEGKDLNDFFKSNSLRKILND